MYLHIKRYEKGTLKFLTTIRMGFYFNLFSFACFLAVLRLSITSNQKMS